MSDEASRQSVIDAEHLQLLSLGYMISAAITAFFSLFGLIYAAMGLLISKIPIQQHGERTSGTEAAPALIGWLFAGIGTAIFVFAVIFAAAKLWAALCIRNRRSRTFCMIVAGFSCLEVPYGTALGVLSFIVLGRDSVAQLFKPRSVTQGAKNL